MCVRVNREYHCVRIRGYIAVTADIRILNSLRNQSTQRQWTVPEGPLHFWAVDQRVRWYDKRFQLDRYCDCFWFCVARTKKWGFRHFLYTYNIIIIMYKTFYNWTMPAPRDYNRGDRVRCTYSTSTRMPPPQNDTIDCCRVCMGNKTKRA